ncbi:SpoVR family protein [Vibrio chagasii]|nr:SpoVR family protein [Vibrio chagasii]
MFRDIRRICEEPTDEDREWFPELAERIGWRRCTLRCTTSDESFIQPIPFSEDHSRL